MQFSGVAVNRQDKKQRLIIIGAIVLVVLFAGLAAFFFWKSHHQNGATDAARSQRVISEVSKLYIVPTNETPTVAAIQDRSKLGSQAFFQNAQNGDYLLVYSSAKLALLYRESVNKLVNVGPVQQSAANAQSGQ